MSHQPAPRLLADTGRADPRLIQGGMGVAVSGWRLARAVARAGQMGVVSGTALDVVHARQLQDGDPGGHLRRAYASFPLPGVADRVLERWYVEGGRDPDQPYRPHPMLTARPTRSHLELVVLANYAEVWLGKEGHDGLVGVNHLEKIQMAIAPSLYGALLAGVDAVLVGAGIPSALPSLLDRLAALEAVDVRLDVAGTAPGDEHRARFDPGVVGRPLASLRRPPFLAIVSSVSLARFLARDDATRPDGFVVELPVAGGHNAPPRGPRRVGPDGEPSYGPRDEVDPAAMRDLGLPFWLAGGYGTAEGLRCALAAGASGVQVGSAFALSAEAGLRDDLAAEVRRKAHDGELVVRTDPAASPSGFPFKVASVDGSLSDAEVVAARDRVCDLGYLRQPFLRPDGTLGYRCPSEPVEDYVRKGGDIADTEGRLCLCNGLTAAVGLGQVRTDGEEPALVTIGASMRDAAGVPARPEPASEVVSRILGSVELD